MSLFDPPGPRPEREALLDEMGQLTREYSHVGGARAEEIRRRMHAIVTRLDRLPAPTPPAKPAIKHVPRRAMRHGNWTSGADRALPTGDR